MKRLISLSIATVLYFTGATITRALPLECNGNLVSVGDTQKQVLSICGEPTVRQENRWIYKREGDLPEILIFADGVVMSIEVGHETGFGSTSPLGDHL